MSDELSGNVKVLCRFRPLNEKEKAMSEQLCVSFPPDRQTVIISPQEYSSSGPLRFNFDRVFPPDTEQEDVYAASAKPIVEAVMQGFNGTVFAYGQTSSGKTFTMTGPDIEDVRLMGIIPRMVSTVFEQIEAADEHIEYSVKVGYAEIYLEKIRDLLEPGRKDLRIHEDRSRGVYIADLTENYVSSEMEVYELMKIGSNNREVGYTHMNAGSSRSHSIFILTIAQNNTLDYSAKTGKLYLVDLAGSEKVGKTGAEGKRLEEAKNINKSLTTLGLVIYSLTDGKSSHIPYRDSKLTRVLQDSLGGNSKTSLIVTCSPSPYNEAETISTLRFGIRAKAIKNKPKVNREYTVAELKLMLAKAHEEIAKRDRVIRALESSLKANGIAATAGSELLSDGGTELSERLEDSDSEREDQGALDEVIMELEEVRNRLSEEVGEHSVLKTQHQAVLREFDSVSEEFKNLSHICSLQKQTITKHEARLAELEELNEKLSITKESMAKEVELFSNRQLQLEQSLMTTTVELEQLQNDLKHQQTEGTSRVSQEAIEELEQKLASQSQVVTQLEQRNLALQTSLDEAFSTKVTNVEELKEQLTNEIRAQEQQKWHIEKAQLQQELITYKHKTSTARTQLEQMTEAYNALKITSSEGERSMAKKCETLERNLEQLTLMYHQLVSQKSVLKVDKQVNERKIQRISEKHRSMEEQLKRATAKLAEQEENNRKLTEELAAYKDNNVRGSICGYGVMNIAKNIKKTIKGGGNRQSAFYSQRGSPRSLAMPPHPLG